jgi:hypothetical protein
LEGAAVGVAGAVVATEVRVGAVVVVVVVVVPVVVVVVVVGGAKVGRRDFALQDELWRISASCLSWGHIPLCVF